MSLLAYTQIRITKHVMFDRHTMIKSKEIHSAVGKNITLIFNSV